MPKMTWKYNIGDRIVECDGNGYVKRNLTIIDRKIVIRERKVKKKYSIEYKMRNFKYYKYKCNVCGWAEGWIHESNLYSLKNGCACCAGQTIAAGINDVATTHPHLVKFFKTPSEALCYSAHSTYCPELICPDCGYVKAKMPIDALTSRGFGCPSCSDTISYGEKFINNLLEQANVEYKRQLSRTTYLWCENYRYDFWFRANNEEYIIEVHGKQHYSYRNGWSANVMENDAAKQKLANANGFDNDHYIVLDCRYSKFEWIKNSIEISVLPDVLNLLAIDFEMCHQRAVKSLTKEICEYWEANQGSPINLIDMSNHFGLATHTISAYIQAGKKLGWVTYDATEKIKKQNQERIGSKEPYPNRKKVVALDEDSHPICIFKSVKDAESKSKQKFGVLLNYATIGYTCRVKKNHDLKGYYFWYLEDYIKEFGEDSLQDIA